jgi:hypothetical protein
MPLRSQEAVYGGGPYEPPKFSKSMLVFSHSLIDKPERTPCEQGSWFVFVSANKYPEKMPLGGDRASSLSNRHLEVF